MITMIIPSAAVILLLVTVVDASTLIKRGSYKNEMIHTIADVTCSKESTELRHRRRRQRQRQRNLGSKLDLDNLFVRKIDSNTDLESVIESVDESDTTTDYSYSNIDSKGVIAGTMWKPSTSSSASNGGAASGAAAGVSPNAKIAVSITINAPDPDQLLCNYINDNINGFVKTGCHEYLITGWIDLCDGTLNEIEDLPDVIYIKPTRSGSTASTTASTTAETSALGSGFESSDPNRFTGSGTVKSQAIAAMQITKLLEYYPELTGEGLKLGIISDSFSNNACNTSRSNPNNITEEDDIFTGNLPSEQDGNKVILLNDNAVPGVGQCAGDEGRAMAQLIYDLIPGVQIYFYTGFLFGNFAEAINALSDAGCNVIVDDVRFFEEPVYQLGLTAQAAQAAADKGVQYYSAAGNNFDNSFESIYKGIPCPPELDEFGVYTSCLDFGNGNTKQFLDVRSGGNLTMYWDQPWSSISGPPGTQLDFDAYLFYAVNDSLASSGIDFNINGDAFEELVIEKPNVFYLTIAFFQDPDGIGLDADGSIIKWISFGPEFNSVEPGPVDKPTVTGPANAPGVAAVAAAFSLQTFGQLVTEPFSSLGGIPLLFDTDGNRYPEPFKLPQPRFTGPDGDYTTFFGRIGFGVIDGQFSDTSPPRFFGTSAAAPSVSAVGIILLQACTLLKEGRRLGGTAQDQRGDGDGGVVRRKLKDSKDAKSTKAPKRRKQKKTNSPTLPPFDCSLPANIFRILEETAIDMNENKFDFLSGSGFINALAAIERLIELVDGPSAAAAATIVDEGQCPIPNFLFPIESFFDTPFNP